MAFSVVQLRYGGGAAAGEGGGRAIQCWVVFLGFLEFTTCLVVRETERLGFRTDRRILLQHGLLLLLSSASSPSSILTSCLSSSSPTPLPPSSQFLSHCCCHHQQAVVCSHELFFCWYFFFFSVDRKTEGSRETRVTGWAHCGCCYTRIFLCISCWM
jgi:hypothetical protein